MNRADIHSRSPFSVAVEKERLGVRRLLDEDPRVDKPSIGIKEDGIMSMAEMEMVSMGQRKESECVDGKTPKQLILMPYQGDLNKIIN